MNGLCCLLPLALCCLVGCSTLSQKPSVNKVIKLANKPVDVKVVIVTMFEIGEDQGDEAGEFQLWRERQGLVQKFSFPQAHHDLYYNPATGVLGMVTGMGTNKSSSAVMALGLDSRFDLRKAYWLVAGIAGFDPVDAGLGSAAWARFVVDGDLAHEIDARELPEGWSTGYLPLFSRGPYAAQQPPNQGEMFALNAQLAEWAFALTRNVTLADDAEVAALRAQARGFVKAQTPPGVLLGDNLAAMTFWHGHQFNAWANAWVGYWTRGEANFVSSAMEDSGTAQSLKYLDAAGKADYQRLMVLRTASNFTMPVNDTTAAASLLANGESYPGRSLAIENAYRVGSVVVDHLVSHWDEHQSTLPYE